MTDDRDLLDSDQLFERWLRLTVKREERRLRWVSRASPERRRLREVLDAARAIKNGPMVFKSSGDVLLAVAYACPVDFANCAGLPSAQSRCRASFQWQAEVKRKRAAFQLASMGWRRVQDFRSDTDLLLCPICVEIARREGRTAWIRASRGQGNCHVPPPS